MHHKGSKKGVLKQIQVPWTVSEQGLAAVLERFRSCYTNKFNSWFYWVFLFVAKMFSSIRNFFDDSRKSRPFVVEVFCLAPPRDSIQPTGCVLILTLPILNCLVLLTRVVHTITCIYYVSKKKNLKDCGQHGAAAHEEAMDTARKGLKAYRQAPSNPHTLRPPRRPATPAVH